MYYVQPVVASVMCGSTLQQKSLNRVDLLALYHSHHHIGSTLVRFTTPTSSVDHH